MRDSSLHGCSRSSRRAQRQLQQPHLPTPTSQGLIASEHNPSQLCYPPASHVLDPVSANALSFNLYQAPISEQTDWFQSFHSNSHDFLVSSPGYIEPFLFDGGATCSSTTTEYLSQEVLDILPGTLSNFENTLEPCSTPDIPLDNTPYAYQDDPPLHSFQQDADNHSPPSKSISPGSPPHVPTTTSTVSPSSVMSTGSNSQPNSAIRKRKLNTLAARRYRQKRVDQVTELETALKNTQRERDDLSVRVARLEGELGALRQMLKSGK